MRHFHAHIYWDNQKQREKALDIREQLESFGCSIGQVMDKPVGPHPLPMYQANYSSSNAKVVETFLSEQELTVLLHDVTGDHIKDHTEGARWIGKELDLDIDWIKSILNPSLM